MNLSDEKTQPEPDFRLLYDEARAQLDQQVGTVDAIDMKTGVFFATASALVAIIAGLAALKTSSPPTWWTLLVLGGIVYAGVTVASTWSMWGETWEGGPKLDVLAGRLAEVSQREALLETVKTIQCDMARNRCLLHPKVWAMRVAAGGVLVLSCLAFLAGAAALLASAGP